MVYHGVLKRIDRSNGIMLERDLTIGEGSTSTWVSDESLASTLILTLTAVSQCRLHDKTWSPKISLVKNAVG